jgi:hypothetical protein
MSAFACSQELTFQGYENSLDPSRLLSRNLVVPRDLRGVRFWAETGALLPAVDFHRRNLLSLCLLNPLLA